MLSGYLLIKLHFYKAVGQIFESELHKIPSFSFLTDKSNMH